jgi:uncharacterized repeat protein (TIGR03803 family)
MNLISRIRFVSIFSLVLIVGIPFGLAQTWTPKADLPGDGRTFAFSFTIGTKIYVGAGADGSFQAKKDFWEYNTTNNTWTQKGDFEGGIRYGATAFSLNGKGYVTLGSDAYSNTLYKDVWEYNPNTDDWTQLADFPGAIRLGATAFVIGGKAYIGMGQGRNPANPNDAIALKDLWLFDLGDPNVWSQKSDLPGVARYFAAGFSIGATGYVGGGSDDNDQALADFWQYNPLGDSWSRKADLGGGAKGVVPGVSLNGKGYVGSAAQQDFWQYNPITDSWTQKNDLSTARLGSIVLTANGKIYAGTGLGNVPLKDLYEYTPDADPTYAGKMYSTATGGGSGSGVIFQASSTGTGVTSIYNFDLSAINGTNPSGKLLYLNGKLYGTTTTGGPNASGVLYQLDLTGNVYTRILNFNTYNSVGAVGGMTYVGGKLYGLARGGSGAPHGFIYELDPATNTFTKKASFNGTNGSDPYGGELLLVGSKLYGVTMSGGTSDLGVIFEYDFKTNVITKRADFNGTNGAQPRSGLMEFSGMLYGMTPVGGSSDKGVLYEFDMTSGTIAKRKDFSGNDGELPYGGLTALNDKLYGVTSDLGTGFTGVIFEYDPASHVFTKKFDFDNTSAYTGSDPACTLTLINGKLYGNASLGGDNNKGALFSYDITSGFTKIFNFDDATGVYPGSAIIFVRDNQTLSFNSLPAKMIDDAPFQLTATGSLGLPVQFQSSDESVATINGNMVTITGAGTTTITAYIGRDNQISSVSQPLTVNKKTQTITFNALDGKTFGDASFQVGATASSGLSVSYSSDNLNVATINGNTVTIVGAGTATITAMQSGNGTYSAATSVPQVLTVAKANQVITFGPLADKTFGNDPFQLSASTTSGLPISFNSNDGLVASINGSTLTIGNAGTATITASQAGNNNYNAAAPVPRSLVVAKGFQEIFFDELPIKKVGDAPFMLTATTTFFYAPTFASSNPAVATVNNSTVTIVGPGQTTISASYAGNVNLLPAQTVTRILTVKAVQVITFNTLGTISYTPTLQLSATSNSGLPVQYTSETLGVATVSGSTLTIVGVGATKITASQPGNASFSAAADVSQILTVAKANQTITFEAITDKKLGGAKFNLIATASSGLPVSFLSTSTKISISGNEVTMAAAGSVTIDAAQAGSILYNAATTVQKTFCISPARPVITLSNNNSETPVLTSSATSGNQWYLNGNAINGATNQTLSVSSAGVYKVQASPDGCNSDFSENFPVVITGIDNASVEKISIYPNPVEDKLTIAIPYNGGSKVSIIRADGTAILTLQTMSSILEVDASSYASGLYLLNIQNNRSQYIGKFIKK